MEFEFNKDYDELDLQAIDEMDFTRAWESVLRHDGISEEGINILLHYGVKRRSGRYPWGSGENPYQHGDNAKFMQARREMQAKGMTEAEIAKAFGVSTGAVRARVAIAHEEEVRRLRATAKSLKEHGLNPQQIADKIGKSRSWVDKELKRDESKENLKTQTSEVANLLASRVSKDSYIDVSRGVDIQMGVSKTKLDNAVKSLVDSGEYEVIKYRIKQITNPDGNSTPTDILVPKGTEYTDVSRHTERIKTMDMSLDRGSTTKIQAINTPKSIDWDRVKIRYAIPEGEKGHGVTDVDGALMDGTMLLRPGTKDLDMGKNKYAQVRIAVGGTHYLKGMAIYGDPKDFPPGVDIIFNTNKTKNKTREEVLKPLERGLESDNPFSATIKKQNVLLDKNGKPVVDKERTAEVEKTLGRKLGTPIYKTGAINIVNEAGDWNEWGKALSSQFLSKQPEPVVRERLKATLKQVDQAYDEISKVDNPVIRAKLLESYSSDLESKQVHLKAAAPKGFAPHVILPVSKLKENEVYAPNYPDGTRVILIRYPHAGTFELPELIVNNSKNSPGRKIVGDATDAIGIHPKVAQKMSGADFDGDTAYVLPNNAGKYKTRPALKGLEDFDPNMYEDKPGTFKPLTKGTSTNREMGVISNLISDMELKGASDEEVTRAVKHSMVVIDSAKHKLNYRRSEEENGIPALKKKYMAHVDTMDYGSYSRFDERTRKTQTVQDEKRFRDVATKREKTSGSTIVSRSKNDKVQVAGYDVEVKDPKTGKTKTVTRGKVEVPLITMVKDARDFLTPSSDQREKDYANYVNELKARKIKVDEERKNIKTVKKDPKAALIYADEVASLETKLKESLGNAPKERQAQLLAKRKVDKEIKARGEDNPIDKKELKKLRQQAITTARQEVGAKRNPVKITPDEWDAIQANAISPTMLSKLVRNMNDDELKELATPRPKNDITGSRLSKAKQLHANGYTYAQIAELLGVSATTVSKAING